MNSGLFITFEGIDGTGKSTQLSRAVRYIQKCGAHPAVGRLVLFSAPGVHQIPVPIPALDLSSASPGPEYTPGSAESHRFTAYAGEKTPGSAEYGASAMSRALIFPGHQ